PELFAEAFASLAKGFEPKEGGFGRAPKFPAAMAMDFLLRHHARTKRPDALYMVEFSLERMAQGGIYDHLGGGFARYSTDDVWLVPHFEKMLYDNAELIGLYTLAWQHTRAPLFARRVAETVDWLIRDMRAEGDAFASAFDADSEGEEGRSYVWTEAEIDARL